MVLDVPLSDRGRGVQVSPCLARILNSATSQINIALSIAQSRGRAVECVHPHRSCLPMNPPRPRLPDVLCLSHLRWDFVFQRPQHLLTRWADYARVFYLEEPIFGEGPPALQVKVHGDRVN